MKQILASLFVTLAFYGITAADDYVIEPGKFADIKLPDGKGAKINRLTITPTPVQKADGLVGGRLIFIGEPGVTYKVRQVIVDFKKEIYEDSEHNVKFSGQKKEDKKDDVIPDPKPKPTPGGPFWIIIVEESTARTLDEAAIYRDAPLWAGIEAAGHKWRIYDKDAPDCIQKGYTSKATPYGFPAVLLMTADGTTARGFKLNRPDLEALKK